MLGDTWHSMAQTPHISTGRYAASIPQYCLLNVAFLACIYYHEWISSKSNSFMLGVPIFLCSIEISHILLCTNFNPSEETCCLHLSSPLSICKQTRLLAMHMRQYYIRVASSMVVSSTHCLNPPIQPHTSHASLHLINLFPSFFLSTASSTIASPCSNTVSFHLPQILCNNHPPPGYRY